MKKSDLKKVLKPIVKECIQEALIEEGLLSGVIAEVVKGLGTGQQPIVERQTAPTNTPTQPSSGAEQQIIAEEQAKRRTRIEETRKQMLDAIGSSTYNGVDLFEGTQPMSAGGEQTSPLAGTAPGDSGVDISGLMGNKKVWNVLVEGKK